MPDQPATRGHSMITRRALIDLIRAAVLGSYGVTGLAGHSVLSRTLRAIGLTEPAIRVRLDGRIEIDVHLSVGYGLPVAEVARQVDSAVRYNLRRALGREVERLTIHVGGLDFQPAALPPASALPAPAGDGDNPVPGEVPGSGSAVTTEGTDAT